MLPVPDVRALRPLFTPERPGPTMWAHVAATGVGYCLADRWPHPRAALVVLPGGNLSLAGEPTDLPPGLRGFADAPPAWRAALGDPPTWARLVAVLPADVAVPGSTALHPRPRLLGPADAAALAALDPDSGWIHDSWGGAAALAAAGVARGVVVDGRAVSVAVPFYRGEEHEDIGVVTDSAFRGRGLSTSCAAALVTDIRARGRVPTWTTSPGNGPSRAVAARLGFRHERDDVLYALGVPVPDG